MRRTLPVVLVALLPACTTMTPEQQRHADEEQCRSYGFVRKNDAFAECLQRLDLDRRAQRRNMSAPDPWFEPSPRVIVVERQKGAQ